MRRALSPTNASRAEPYVYLKVYLEQAADGSIRGRSYQRGEMNRSSHASEAITPFRAS